MEEKILNDKYKKDGGYSFIEVLISVVILSMIVLASSTAFIYATKKTRNNQIKLTAMNLANKSIEYIRSLTFTDIGTKFKTPSGAYVYGDPPGEILQEDIVEVNGVEYKIETVINWMEESEWDLNGSAEWDYKEVIVTVVPIGFEESDDLKQRIETFVTRDVSQPALKGYNIRIRCIRGWSLPGEGKTPVRDIDVLLETGPSAVRFVRTSSKGVASLIDLASGEYKVVISPESKGYMLHPKYSKEQFFDLTDDDKKTQSKEFEIELPCNLQFYLKRLDGTPILSSSLEAGATGSIKITVPYPAGEVKEANFTASDIDGAGKLPLDLMGNFWPVGDGFPGAYSITNVAIDDLQFMGCYSVAGGLETLWNGKFSAPGTVQDLILYFNLAPTTPAGIHTTWVNGDHTILTGSHRAVDEEDIPTAGGVFTSSDPTRTLIFPQDGIAHFNATNIYFENEGDGTNPGLFLHKKSSLYLHAGIIVFRGAVEFDSVADSDDMAKIVLSTVWEDGYEANSVNGSIIDDTNAEDGVKYGKVYFVEPVKVGETIIIDEGGYYFPEGIILPNQSNRLIKLTKENYIG